MEKHIIKRKVARKTEEKIRLRKERDKNWKQIRSGEIKLITSLENWTIG